MLFIELLRCIGRGEWIRLSFYCGNDDIIHGQTNYFMYDDEMQKYHNMTVYQVNADSENHFRVILD